MDDRVAGGDRFALGVACAFIAVLNVADGIYSATGQPMPLAIEGAPFFTSIPLVAWFRNYSVRHRITWPIDMGYFLMSAWPLIIPYYLIRQERRTGFGKVALFGFFYLASWAVGVAVWVWARVL